MRLGKKANVLTIRPSVRLADVLTRGRRGLSKIGLNSAPAISPHGPWQVQEPGYAEVDLVAPCGPCARGEFGYSLNRTDVSSGWCVSRAILGRGEAGVVAALEHLRRGLPLALRGLDSDNGSEFSNWRRIDYCRAHAITFTRSCSGSRGSATGRPWLRPPSRTIPLTYIGIRQ